MNGNSSTCPSAVEQLKNDQYRVRWSVQRNDRVSIPDGIQFESWDFEYNSKYPAKAVTQKEIMLAIIRERYDADDEISLSMKRDEDSQKLQEHEDYVSFARTTAELILNNNEEI
jgi:hypothetical protein